MNWYDSCTWPWRRLEVLLRQLREGDLVKVCHFEPISVVDHVSEVGEELLDGVGHEAELVALLTLVLAVQGRVTGVTVLVLIVL